MENLSSKYPTPAVSQPCEVDFSELKEWQVRSPSEAWGSLELLDSSIGEAGASAKLMMGGAGDLTLIPPSPIPIAESARTVQLWVQVPTAFDNTAIPQVVLLLEDGKECPLGSLDFDGWHLLVREIGHLDAREMTGLAVRGLLAREEQPILLDAMSFGATEAGAPSGAETEFPEVYQGPISMLPSTDEEVTNSIEQDGISFVFEARSLSAVARFIYTPIEGTLSDLELEVNGADPISPAADGGVTIEMAGQLWSSVDETIERHFVSCEQVGDWVEARWQWKHGEELADFLYKMRIVGKSMIFEVEGGSNKATGLSLGHVENAITPQSIPIPYFNFGDKDVKILCTAGIFISSYLDWFDSHASSMFGAPEGDLLALNGGCIYEPASDGKRNPLRERCVLTVSRHFDGVLPSVPKPIQTLDQGTLAPLVWHRIKALESAEDGYVKAYESLLMLKQLGMDHLHIIHPADTWHDSGASGTLTVSGAAAKGGDDALAEYLEAIGDLGYSFGLYANFRDISPLDESWGVDKIARLTDGNLANGSPGSYRLRPSEAVGLAADRASSVAEKFENSTTFVAELAANPPWSRLDHDSRLKHPADFNSILRAEWALLTGQAAVGLTIAEGGCHWLYGGLCHGFLARPGGHEPSRKPLLLDFALRFLHPQSAGGGIGTPEDFFGREIPPEMRHSRSPYLDRYLAVTAAFGHAGLLPDPEEWGLASAVKTYYMLQNLQVRCIGIPISSIRYHHDGSFLETSEALLSGAHELSQIRVEYENGLQVNVNGGWEQDWSFDHLDTTYRLPPGSFWAHSPDGLLVYSADAGSGHVDYAHCSEYHYCDTRGVQLDTGAISLSGAAVVQERNWQIDIFPIDDCSQIRIEPAYYWPDRRLPRLRLLAFASDEDEPETIRAEITEKVVEFQPEPGAFKYRITLPEWMVEPGK